MSSQVVPIALFRDTFEGTITNSGNESLQNVTAGVGSDDEDSEVRPVSTGIFALFLVALAAVVVGCSCRCCFERLGRPTPKCIGVNDPVVSAKLGEKKVRCPLLAMLFSSSPSERGGGRRALCACQIPQVV